MAYKITAKALQRRLQPLLLEVINSNKTAFLPNRHILDNVLVLHKPIAWTQELEKIWPYSSWTFKMAYDTIHLLGLFCILYAFGILDHFLRLVKMLFTGAKASVYIKGGESDVFLVQKGIMQGYLFAPYLFLVVEEALNIMARNSLERIVLQEAIAE